MKKIGIILSLGIAFSLFGGRNSTAIESPKNELEIVETQRVESKEVELEQIELNQTESISSNPVVEEVIVFNDPVLEKYLKDTFFLGEEVITKEMMKKVTYVNNTITEYDAEGNQVARFMTDLQGLEYAINLENFTFVTNASSTEQIKNIQVLSQLPKLRDLNLGVSLEQERGYEDFYLTEIEKSNAEYTLHHFLEEFSSISAKNAILNFSIPMRMPDYSWLAGIDLNGKFDNIYTVRTENAYKEKISPNVKVDENWNLRYEVKHKTPFVNVYVDQQGIIQVDNGNDYTTVRDFYSYVGMEDMIKYYDKNHNEITSTEVIDDAPALRNFDSMEIITGKDDFRWIIGDNAFTYRMFQKSQGGLKGEKTINIESIHYLIGERTFNTFFDSRGGSEVPAIRNLKLWDLIDKPEDPVREGYTFEGWYHTEYNEEYELPNYVDDDMVLYAKWRGVGKHWVLYDKNPPDVDGLWIGNLAHDPKEYGLDEEATVLDKGDIRFLDWDAWENNKEVELLHFSSWNTEPDGSGISYYPGDKILVPEDITLYAQWVPIQSLHVTYDGNGSSKGDVPVDTTTYDTGEEVTVLDQGTLSKGEYSFIGWNTQADGKGKMYQPGEKFSIERETVLYAQWKIPVVSVSIPTQMVWAAFESDITQGKENSWNIVSAKHSIQVHKDSIDVAITIKNVTKNLEQTDQLPVTSQLVLGLNTILSTGTPEIQGSHIRDLFTVSDEPLATMKSGDTIQLEFEGTYEDTAGFPKKRIQPEFHMILKIMPL